MKRKRIKNKWFRLLYLPLAIIQWVFFIIVLSGIGGIFIISLGIALSIENIFMLEKDNIKDALGFIIIPIILPFLWWYDYITKGEIGPYE